MMLLFRYLLCLDDLSVWFDDLVWLVVDWVSLSVDVGCILVLVGEFGFGKLFIVMLVLDLLFGGVGCCVVVIELDGDNILDWFVDCCWVLCGGCIGIIF